MAQELQGPRSQRSQGPGETPARTGAGTRPLPRHPSPGTPPPGRCGPPRAHRPNGSSRKTLMFGAGGAHTVPHSSPRSPPSSLSHSQGTAPWAPEKCTLSARQAPRVGRAAENLPSPGSPGVRPTLPVPQGPLRSKRRHRLPYLASPIPGRKSQIPEPRKLTSFFFLFPGLT